MIYTLYTLMYIMFYADQHIVKVEMWTRWTGGYGPCWKVLGSNPKAHPPTVGLLE